MNKSIKSLTSFRFLAAFGVFLHHLNKLSFGPLGVTFFFILSGFILTYSYHKKAQQLDKNGIISFYIARFGRIYPVAFLTFIISIPLVYQDYSQSMMAFIGKAMFQLLLLQSYVPNSHIYYSFNGVAWSISTEIFFYLMFPFILKWLFKHKDRPWFFGLFIVLIMAIEIGLGWYLRNSLQGLDSVYWLFYISPFFRIFDFLSGCCIAFLFILNPVRNKSTAVFSIVELASIALLVLVYANVSRFPGSMSFGILFIPFIALMIYVFAHENGIISRIMQWKVFVFLGEASFSFYMVHQLVFGYYWGKFHISLQKIIDFPVVLIISICLSSLIYLFYEIPLRDKIRANSNLIRYKINMIYHSLKGKPLTEEERVDLMT